MNIINKTSAEHYNWGQNCDGWHLLKNDHLSVIRELVPPGSSEVNHYHEHSRQLFFVLEGEATMEISGETFILYKSDAVEIPPLSIHKIINKGDLTLEFLVISRPPSHGDRITV